MNACRLCGSTTTSPAGTVGPYVLERCRECDAMFRRGHSPAEERTEFNEDDISCDGFEELYLPARTRTYDRVLDFLGPARGRRFLDVGCALGWFMQAAEKRGYAAWGVEPYPDMADRARKLTRRPVATGVIEDADYENGSFDVITMMDVLEHTVDPADCLIRLWRMLDEGGMLVVRVPDSDGLLPRISHFLMRATGGRFSTPVWLLWRFHRWGFNGASLGLLMKKCGFEVVRQYGEDAQDLAMMKGKKWASNPLVYAAVNAIIRLSHLLRMHDEVVIVGRRVSRTGAAAAAQLAEVASAR